MVSSFRRPLASYWSPAVGMMAARWRYIYGQSAPWLHAYQNNPSQTGQSSISGVPSKTHRPPLPYLRTETINRAYQGSARTALTATKTKVAPVTACTVQRVDAARTATTADHTNNRLRDIILPSS